MPETSTANFASQSHSRAGADPHEGEGAVARMIEQQTAKIPSDIFLWAAGGSIAASLALKLTCDDRNAEFVGQWAPTFLMLGLYNKIVKELGSDRTERFATARG